eukprot:6654956-Prorocentrum_lima.AAC.1
MRKEAYALLKKRPETQSGHHEARDNHVEAKHHQRPPWMARDNFPQIILAAPGQNKAHVAFRRQGEHYPVQSKHHRCPLWKAKAAQA